MTSFGQTFNRSAGIWYKMPALSHCASLFAAVKLLRLQLGLMAFVSGTLIFNFS